MAQTTLFGRGQLAEAQAALDDDQIGTAQGLLQQVREELRAVRDYVQHRPTDPSAQLQAYRALVIIVGD